MPKRHFAGAPVCAIILKIFAVLSFIVSVAGGVLGILDLKKKIADYVASPGATPLKMTDLLGAFREPVTMIISGIVMAIVIWAFAEVIMMLRETEFNTRVAAGIKEVVAVEDYSAVAPAADTTDAE